MQGFFELIDNFESSSKKKVEFEFQNKINEFFTSAQSFLNQISDDEIKNDVLSAKEDLISNFDNYLHNFTEEIKAISDTLSNLTAQIQKNLEKGYFSSTKSIIMPAIEKIFEKVTKDNIWGIQIYFDIVDEIKQRMANAIVPKIQSQIKVDKGGIEEIKKIEQVLEQKSQDIKLSIPKIRDELLKNLKIGDIENKFIDKIIPKISSLRNSLSKTLMAISEDIKNDFVELYQNPIEFLNELREEMRQKEANLINTSFKESLGNKINLFKEKFGEKGKYNTLEKLNEIYKIIDTFIADFGKKEKKETKERKKSKQGKKVVHAISDEIISNFENIFNKYIIEIYDDFTNLIELSSKIRENIDIGYAQTRQSVILPEISKIFDEITKEKIYEVELFNEIVNDIKVRMELDILVKLEQELLNIKVDLGEVKNIKQILEQKSKELKDSLPKIKEDLIVSLKTGDMNEKINNKIKMKLNNLNEHLKSKSTELKDEFIAIDQEFLQFFNRLTQETTLKTTQEKLYELFSQMVKVEEDVKPKIRKVEIELPKTNRAEFLAKQIDKFLIETPTTLDSSIIFVDINGQTQVIDSKQDIISSEEQTNMLNSSTTFENPFDITLKDVNINNIVPYGYKVTDFNTVGIEEEIQPTKKLLDEGLQLSWTIPEIKPKHETKIELELERRISRTLLLNIDDEVNAINTWFSIEPYKRGYAARSKFENFQDKTIENLILEDEIPNTFNIVQIIPVEDVYHLEMNKTGFDQLVLWQYSTIESGNKVEHFYYLYDRRFFILTKYSVNSIDDGLLLEIFRLVEPNIKYYELVVSFFIKFHQFIPELYIKEIIPENNKINLQIPTDLEKTLEIQEGKNFQIWKIIPNISKPELKFGYICSGSSIKSDFPIELYLPGYSISTSKESMMEPKKQSLFIPEFHQVLSQNKRGE
ncbi:MAG: hypothetical protein ACTSR3_16340 [Candidatus Helarchaeota archaeon]